MDSLLTATMSCVKQICSQKYAINAVGTELHLQLLSGEHLKYKTSNVSDDACLDVVAETFGIINNRQNPIFDVKVSNPFAKTCINLSLAQYHIIVLNKTSFIPIMLGYAR